MLGLDVVRDGKALRRRIGVSGQYAAVDEHLTGFENLDMVGRLYHLGAKASRQRAEELLERFDLTEAAGRVVKGWSGRHAPAARPRGRAGRASLRCSSSTSRRPGSTRAAGPGCGT